MGTEQSMTTASRIDYHPIYALERCLADARSLGGLTEISVEELECLLTHLKPVLEENERLRSKVETAAVIFEEYGRLHRKKGTREGDMKAAANERYAAEMRAALSQKGER